MFAHRTFAHQVLAKDGALLKGSFFRKQPSVEDRRSSFRAFKARLHRTLVGVAGVLLVLLWAAPAHAQLSPDRPGMGEGTSVTAPQRLQVEGGYGVATSEAGGTSHDLGQLLVRYGVASWLEVRGGVGSYVAHEAPRPNGYSGTTLGGKAALWRGQYVQLSALSTWGVPTGTGAYEGGDVWQAVALAFDAAVAGPISLSSSLGHTVSYGEGASGETMFTVTGGMGIGEAIGFGLGYAGFYSAGPGRNYVEAMITYLSGPNVQLDVSGAYQVDGYEDELQLGVGVAKRF